MNAMPSQRASELAAKIRGAREDAGLSQRKLASKIGMPQPRLSRREKGEVEFRASEVELIANALRIPVEELLTWERAS